MELKRKDEFDFKNSKLSGLISFILHKLKIMSKRNYHRVILKLNMYFYFKFEFISFHSYFDLSNLMCLNPKIVCKSYNLENK